MKNDEIALNSYHMDDLVEKPKIEEAPSNITIMGRYIMARDI